MAEFPTDLLTTAEVADLAWLTGDWRGQRGEDTIEEIWSHPAGNTLMCMFRWLQAEAVRFFELITIEQDEAGIHLRIKHFDPGLRGWEEKDDAVAFSLTGLDRSQAVFFRAGDRPLWLVYRQPDEDTLVAFFEKPGEAHEPDDEFHYRRAG